MEADPKCFRLPLDDVLVKLLCLLSAAAQLFKVGGCLVFRGTRNGKGGKLASEITEKDAEVKPPNYMLTKKEGPSSLPPVTKNEVVAKNQKLIDKKSEAGTIQEGANADDSDDFTSENGVHDEDTKDASENVSAKYGTESTLFEAVVAQGNKDTRESAMGSEDNPTSEELGESDDVEDDDADESVYSKSGVAE
ncbi:hypothetical protein U1Q18_025679 [Sarracenia purpurea var. burkii]